MARGTIPRGQSLSGVVTPQPASNVGAGIRRAGALRAQGTRDLQRGVDAILDLALETNEENRTNTEEVYIAKVLNDERKNISNKEVAYGLNPEQAAIDFEASAKTALGTAKAHLTPKGQARLEIALDNLHTNQGIIFQRVFNGIQKQRAFGAVIAEFKSITEKGESDARDFGTSGIGDFLFQAQLALERALETAEKGKFGHEVMIDGSTKNMAIRRTYDAMVKSVVTTALDTNARDVASASDFSWALKTTELFSDLGREDDGIPLNSEQRHSVVNVVLSRIQQRYSIGGIDRRAEAQRLIPKVADLTVNARTGRASEAEVKVFVSTNSETLGSADIKALYHAVADYNNEVIRIDMLSVMEDLAEKARNDPEGYNIDRIEIEGLADGLNRREIAYVVGARGNARAEKNKIGENEATQRLHESLIASPDKKLTWDDADAYIAEHGLGSSNSDRVYGMVVGGTANEMGADAQIKVPTLFPEMRERLARGEYSSLDVRDHLDTLDPPLGTNRQAISVMLGELRSATAQRKVYVDSMAEAARADQAGQLTPSTANVQKYLKMLEKRYGISMPDLTPDDLEKPEVLAKIRAFYDLRAVLTNGMSNYLDSGVAWTHSASETTARMRVFDMLRNLDNAPFLEDQISAFSKAYYTKLLDLSYEGGELPQVVQDVIDWHKRGQVDKRPVDMKVYLGIQDGDEIDSVRKWMEYTPGGMARVSRIRGAFQKAAGTFREVVDRATPDFLFGGIQAPDTPEMWSFVEKVFEQQAKSHPDPEDALKATARIASRIFTSSRYGPHGPGKYAEQAVELYYGTEHGIDFVDDQMAVDMDVHFSKGLRNSPFTGAEWVAGSGFHGDKDGWWLVPRATSKGSFSFKPIWDIHYVKDGAKGVIMDGMKAYPFVPRPSDSFDRAVVKRLASEFNEAMKDSTWIRTMAKFPGLVKGFIASQKRVSDYLHYLDNRNGVTPPRLREWIDHEGDKIRKQQGLPARRPREEGAP